MGTVNLILDTLPKLAKQSTTQYFEPLVYFLKLIRQLRSKRSAPYSIVTSEFKRAKDFSIGNRWVDLNTYSDRSAIDILHRSKMRNASINLYYTSNSDAYYGLYKSLIGHNERLSELVKLIEIDGIDDIPESKDDRELDLTYSLLFLEGLKTEDFNRDRENYINIMSRVNTMPIVNSGVLGTIEAVKSLHDVISVASEREDPSVLFKAISLKIEEFISTVAGIRDNKL
jgi:hypothetical protein